MKWSRPADLRHQLERRWQRGELLRAAVAEPPSGWPLRLSLKSPTAIDVSEHFEAVRHWIAELDALPRLRIEWRERAHRVQGRQRLPDAVWVDSVDDALAFLGKSAEARRFRELWQQTASGQASLLPLLQHAPLQILSLAEHWPRVLAVVAWLQAHPRPDIYLRQVDLPGVDSKFIETHRAILARCFDLVMPAASIEYSASGLAGFARRYGFRDKPARIRLRLLDPQLPNLPGCSGLSDLTLDADSFTSLALPVRQVFITENEINFLAFPPRHRALVIFGAGYGWSALARAHWLQHCELHYWGDIDTHGFAILDRLRAHFPEVQSCLMDRHTLFAHQAQWGEEAAEQRQLNDLHRLNAEESALYDELRHDRIQPRLRLEQERIAYRWVCDALPLLSPQRPAD